MTEQPKTIRIFLPEGNARSVRMAEITSRMVQAIQIPRSKVRAAGGRSEVKNVGVYFLFGQTDEGAKPLAYIGEAENCYERLKQHNYQKDFWTSAVTVVSKTLTFDKAQARYLEWHFLKEARRIGRYKLANSTVPEEPHVSEPVRADLLDYMGTTRVLLSTLGFPLLEELDAPDEKRETLYCTLDKENIRAKGHYTEEGLLVLEGSQARFDVVNDKAAWVRDRREKLVEGGVLEERDGTYVFTEDYVFGTPSGASQTVLGRPSNGWKAWRSETGRTLDELERQS